MTTSPFKTLDNKIVHEYHSFDLWRRITNDISLDVGDLNDLPEALKSLLPTDPTDPKKNKSLAYAVRQTYDTTQARLRHILVKSIGMS